MGHYASEMDPEWGRSIDRTSRKMRLREKIADKPLGHFRAKDIPMLQRLFSYDELDRDDEKRLTEIVGEGE